jgi:Domain of unknown function (DUF4214)/Bacterial Ig domain
MIKRFPSTLALCVVLLLIVSVTLQSFPESQGGLVLAEAAFRTDTAVNPRGARSPSSEAQRAEPKLAASAAGPSRTPVPTVPEAVAITATNRDSFPDHANGSKAIQGDTITYSVTITNSGDTSATGVNYASTIDVNTSTLVGGSPTIQFTVAGDTYSAIGNVRIDTATIAPGSGMTVLENDTVNGAALTGFGATPVNANGTLPNGTNTVTTSNSGTVTMNADGSFKYNPPVGFSGADSFWYTLTKDSPSTGFPTGFPSGSAKVTINVSAPIWFVNSAAAGSGDGRLSTPFNCLTGAASGCFSAVNDGGAGHPKAGDFIFLYKNPTPPAAFTGGLTLLNDQKLIGEGASATLASIAGVSVPAGSDPLPTTGNAPPVITTVAAATNGINIGVGNSNTLRGFTIGNTTGFKIASGASFGTLTTSEMALSGTGGALNLNTGTLAATFISTASTSSASQGVVLQSVGGTLTTGGTTISGNTMQCILVSGSTVTANFGNTSCTGGTDGISLQNNSAGTRTFGTLSVTNNSAVGFLHAVGGGLTNVTGLTTINNPGTRGIDIENAAASNGVTFANVNNTSSGSTGVFLTNNAGAVAFADLDIAPDDGQIALIASTNSGPITSTSGTITAVFGAAIVATSTPLSLILDSTSSSGGTNSISLTTVTGTSIFGAGTLSGASGGPSFLVSGGTVSTTYSGNITFFNSSAATVSVTGGHTGTLTFNTGTVSATTGTGLQFDNADGTYNFNGTTTLNGGDAGIDILNGSGGTFTFGANTSITNPSGTTFNLQSSTANVTYSGNITKSAGAVIAQLDIDFHSVGTVTFNTGTISLTTAAFTGLQCTFCSGTYNFNGPVTLSTGAANAILENSNPGSTFNFGGPVNITTTSGEGIRAINGGTLNFTGGLNIATTAGIGINANTGGTISATQNNTTIVNTITSTTGTALNVSSTNIGASGLTFRSISSNGGTASGIILDSTGSSGGLTVTGDGTNTTRGGNASGGTIANKDDGGADNSGTVGTGIFLSNTSNVTLRRMQLNDHKNYAIRGLSVTGFTLQYSTINGLNGDTTVGEEGNVAFGKTNPSGANGLFGSGLIDNCKISGGIENNLEFYNQSGTLNALTISNSDVKSNTAATGNDGILIESQTSASMTVSVQSCLFDDNKSQAVQLNAIDSSTADITVNSCTLQRTTQGNEGFVFQNASNAHLTAHITNNTSTGIGGVVAFVGNTAGNASATSLLTAVISGNNITHPTSALNSAIIAFLSSTVGQVAPSNIKITSNTVAENSTSGVSRGIFVDTPDTNTTPSFTATITSNSVSVGDNVAGLQGIGLQVRRGTGCFRVSSNTVTFPNGTPAGVNGIRVRQADPGAANLEQGGSAGTAATVLAANNAASTTEVIGTVTVVANGTCLAAPTIVNLADQSVTPGNAPVDVPATAANGQAAGAASNFSGASVSSLVSFATTVLPVQEIKALEVAAAQIQTGEKYNGRSDSDRSFSSTAQAISNQQSAASRLRAVRSNHAVRKSTAADQKPATPQSGGTVNLAVGTITPGSTVVLTYQVTVNNAAPAGTTTISEQGTVSGSNFASVLTDDPDTGAANDATITNIVQPTAANGVVTGRITEDNGAPVAGAVVLLQGTQNRKFITDANGVYRFDNVETSGFYTVTPARVNYTFSPATRSFSQVGETTQAVFGATLATSNLQNPLDTPEYFVRQHYLDFLGREPDEAGFNFWSDQILECGADQNCIDRRRENVSAAYFLSIEFQETGGLVDGLYRASYGVAPQYAAFMPDTRQVAAGVIVGADNWQAKLAANKEAFVNDFVNRAAFHQLYDGMDNSLFVDTLIQHTGASFTAAEHDALVTGLGTGTMTRGEALRSIAENHSFVKVKFNQAFVMMEYFGYLHRDADSSGYAFWLNKLNEFGGNFEQADMVKAFIVSGEYRDRFPR